MTALAARPGDPPRSLLLAGGGVRVAWQAGALIALEQAGLRFAHADGTSGGTLNLAMLLSGLAPREMAERWRTLDVRRFAWPPKPALPLPALGSARGVRRHVFPHLGIDPAAIRAARGLEGTFNVCDHASKACVAVSHREVDLDVLVAGITLPLAMPAVAWRGRPHVDAVWVKDANLTEAVRRGAEEVWLLWCIGNTPTYRAGPFQQYVHMIEQSANGVLFEELDRVRELNGAIAAGHSPYGQRGPVRVHVLRPRHPLPLDPDLLLGRIDAGSLVAMGFRDAVAGLGAPPVALGPSATAMEDPGTRVWWRARFHGEAGSVDLLADVPHAGTATAGRLAGRVALAGAGEALLRDGHVALDGGPLRFAGDLGDGRVLRAHPVDGDGRLRDLRVEVLERDRAVATATLRADRPPAPVVRGAPGRRERWAALRRFERLLGAACLAA